MSTNMRLKRIQMVAKASQIEINFEIAWHSLVSGCLFLLLWLKTEQEFQKDMSH